MSVKRTLSIIAAFLVFFSLTLASHLRIITPSSASVGIFANGTLRAAVMPQPPTDNKMNQWVKNRSQDGYVDVLYPRSAWPVTGITTPTFNDSTLIGRNELYRLVQTTPGVKVAYGYSQGSTVVTRLIQDMNSGKVTDMPAPDELSFVLIANPDRPNGGFLSRVPGIYLPIVDITWFGATPETDYKTIDVARQYDGWADFPEDPLNLLAVANAIMGIKYLHGAYDSINLDDPKNIVRVSGNTTYITIPTEHLPLLQPWRDIATKAGRTETPVLDAIEPVLRTIIESAYDRSTVAPTTIKFGSSFPRLLGSARSQQQHAAEKADSSNYGRWLSGSRDRNASSGRPAHRSLSHRSGVRPSVSVR